jgi:hypothetical protein
LEVGTASSDAQPVGAARAFAGIGRRAGELSPSYLEQLRAELQAGRLVRLGVIAAEFALIVAAIRLLNVESNAFEMIATVALGGFLVHHFLPAAWRLNFFAALSVASVLLVFGWANGAWLLAFGGLLIALCHLPLALWMRVAVIVLAVGAMAAMRTEMVPWISPYVPTIIWPILGSMFMFRLIVYLYDLKHRAAPFSPGRAASYFFMLPNVCFPLFPLVDYKTFVRSAYNEDALRVYQTGTRWMLRGLVHLFLYKIVYFKGVIDPSDAVNGLGVARYLFTSYLLYLKISGIYHMIVGLLHMYGFGLPPTHHLYLLSSSFTDLWRRVNIYWKDFIQKLVFNPAYFALRRKLGDTWAIASATLIAGVLTWFLHAYQWFWIRGEFPIVLMDVLFWTALGLFLTVNVVLESRKGRSRSLGKKRSFRDNALLGLKTAGTFAVIVTLWALWNTTDPDEIEHLWRALLNSGPLDLAVLLGVPIALGLVRVLVGERHEFLYGAEAKSDAPAKVFWPQAALVSLIAAAFIGVALRPALLVPASPVLAELVQDLRRGAQLNTADVKRLQRGYYEDLADATRFNPELWIMYGGRPNNWNDSNQSRERADGIGFEFVPSTAEVFKGALRTINSHGMRDREYALERSPATFRIALIGASPDMGSGVKDDETYENLVEDRLNRELGARTGRKYEILNFSHGGYSPTQKLSVIEQKIFAFQPDLVLYVANSRELEWLFYPVPHLHKNGLLEELPFIKSAMDRAGVTPQAGKPLAESIILESKLAPYAPETLRALLERLRDQALERGIRPGLVLMEVPDDHPVRAKSFDRIGELARSAKLPVLDLQGSFAGIKERKSLWIAPWDSHANAHGHRLLAERLYSLLLEQGLVPVDAAPARLRGKAQPGA